MVFTKMQSLFGVILFSLLPIYLNAEIKLPSFGNRTFVHQGSDITLPWTFTFDVKSVFSRQWQFSKTGKTADFQSLAQISADQDPVIAPGSFSGMSVTKPATLILKSASLNHSGTYRFEIRLNAGSNPPPSDIMVIIAVKPTIEANCSGTKTLKEGENIYCSCKGINGNPPAIAFWTKDGQPYGERGDLTQTLVLRNVDRSDSGTYKCTVRSYNLEDSKSFTLEVQYKPIIEPLEDKDAILGSSVTISCKADGVPEPKYVILHNNTKATDGKEYTINKVEKKDAGLYTCNATNSLGSDSESFSLTVKIVPEGEKDAGLGTGAIVGIVVGVLFLIVVVVALVYWFCIKKNECCCACCGLGGKDDRSEEDRSQNENPAGGYGREDNPYASVDEERERPDKGASTSRNQARPAAEMPPVYAAVDKTKKNKKPPPDAQPALTYASLDPVILQPDSSKMRDRSREETNYAAIDLEKLQSDLV